MGCEGGIEPLLLEKERKFRYVGRTEEVWAALLGPRIRAKDPDSLTAFTEVGSIGNVFLSAGLSRAENSAMTHPTGTPGRPDGPKVEELTPREQTAFWPSRESR